MPQRIQRRRTKGWRKPPGAVCVTRPGTFGNPFSFYGADEGERKRVVKFFRACLERTIRGFPLPAHPNGGAISPGDQYRFRVMARRLADLRGKDLMCWCSPSMPCHADVLLELANKEG